MSQPLLSEEPAGGLGVDISLWQKVVVLLSRGFGIWAQGLEFRTAWVVFVGFGVRNTWTRKPSGQMDANASEPRSMGFTWVPGLQIPQPSVPQPKTPLLGSSTFKPPKPRGLTP